MNGMKLDVGAGIRGAGCETGVLSRALGVFQETETVAGVLRLAVLVKVTEVGTLGTLGQSHYVSKTS